MEDELALDEAGVAAAGAGAKVKPEPEGAAGLGTVGCAAVPLDGVPNPEKPPNGFDAGADVAAGAEVAGWTNENVAVAGDFVAASVEEDDVAGEPKLNAGVGAAGDGAAEPKPLRFGRPRML